MAAHVRLFHVSEEAGIEIFDPRPSPSHFENIKGNVVFAIAETLLHNYLLPRDCPRVTYYLQPGTTETDRNHFFGESTAKFIITVSSEWYYAISKAQLYCYEFALDNFIVLDDCAGYYVSYRSEKPVVCTRIDDIIGELLSRSVELRFTPELVPLSKAVAASSLGFSNIRMRNAKA